MTARAANAVPVRPGQRCSGAAVSTTARDLDSFGFRAHPHFVQGPAQRIGIARQPEISPADPLRLPLGVGRFFAGQIDAEGGERSGRKRIAESSTPNRSPRRQVEYPNALGFPRGHEFRLGRSGLSGNCDDADVGALGNEVVLDALADDDRAVVLGELTHGDLEAEAAEFFAC